MISASDTRDNPPPPVESPVPEFWASPTSAARQAGVDLAVVEDLITDNKVDVERVRGERRVRVDQVMSAVAAGGSTSS